MQCFRDALCLKLPVNDAFVVEEFQTRHDFGAVKAGPDFGKTTLFLDVEHEVAAVEVLHDEEQMRLEKKITKMENPATKT